MFPALPFLRLIASLCLWTALPPLASAQRAAPKKVSVSDGVELHYIEKGEGDPVIFVHGLGGEFSVWARQMDGFARAGYRAISYSRRYNHPNTNKPQPDHSALLEAADLAALLRKLELPKAHIVGFSYGALTALLLSLEHPDLVRTVTLAEPPVTAWLVDIPGEKSDAARAHMKRLLEKGVAPAKKAFEAGDDELAMRTMFDTIADKPVFDTLPDFVQARFRRNIEEVRAIVSSKNPFPEVDRDKVRATKVPTLILTGSETKAVAKFTDAELARLIPEKTRKHVVLEGATHAMWIEQPLPSRQAVLEFIREK